MNPNQALWEKGDFTRIAESMSESGEELARKLGVTKGLKVLDLGCGDGTTALPEARLGAHVLGVDIARNLVEAGNKRAKEAGLANCKFQEGEATDLSDLKDATFDLVVSILGAMFAEAVRRRQGNDPRHTARRPDRHGELDPERSDAGGANPEDQFRLLAAPARGLRQSNDLGIERNVIERFGAAGVPNDRISFVRDTYTFRFASPPAQLVDAFRNYYGPTMNAFDAAEKSGRSEDLKKELDDLFDNQNESPVAGATVIPATYLRVTVTR